MLVNHPSMKAWYRRAMHAPLPSTIHEALRELAARGDSASLQAVADAASADDQFLRRTAVEAIGRHPQGRSLQPVVLKALRDPSDHVVRTACEVIAQWKLTEAHDLVLALMPRAPSATREVAIRALGEIWVEVDFHLVFHAYMKDSEPEVRKEAARVLRERVTFKDWRTLFESFRLDELARHRQWACELAAAFTGTEVLPLLSRLSFDPDGHVRKAALRAIETLRR
jgi:HEAT repeat protein